MGFTMREILFLLLSLHCVLQVSIVDALVSRRQASFQLTQQQQQQQMHYSIPTTSHQNRRLRDDVSKLFLSQWIDDDDEQPTATSKEASAAAAVGGGVTSESSASSAASVINPLKVSPTYEEAGQSIYKEDSDKEMEEKGDIGDTSDSYMAANIDRYAEAIKKRADALGIEGISLEEKQRKEEEAVAKAMAAREGAETGGGQLSQMLDLSQITTEKPQSGPNEDLPKFMYNPEDDMTEEQMIEADPRGQLPIFEQFIATLKEGIYPPALQVFTEVVVLAVTIVFTGTSIYTWDNLSRENAFNTGMVRRPEEVLKSMDGDVYVPPNPDPLSGADLLKQLQEGASAISEGIKDGTLLQQLQEETAARDAAQNAPPAAVGDIPQDL